MNVPEPAPNARGPAAGTERNFAERDPAEGSLGEKPFYSRNAGDVRLRDATVDDAAIVTEIYNRHIALGGACLEDEPKSQDELRRQIEAFGPREALLLLESASRPEVIGWGIIKRYSERSGYRFTCETAVYLRPGSEGRGHGSRIKRALIDRCRHLGYRHMVAKILARNTASIEYNKRLGYEVVGVQRDVGYQNGQWQDVVILQYVLDDVEPPSLEP